MADAFGAVHGNSVGVMLFASQGRLELLEIYPLDDLHRPFPLPEIGTLNPLCGKGGVSLAMFGG